MRAGLSIGGADRHRCTVRCEVHCALHGVVAVAAGHARPHSHFIVPAGDSAPATAGA
jgi:hypothetical protein